MPPTPHRPGPFTLFRGAAFIARGPRMRGRGAMEGGAWWPWGGAAGGASGPGGSPKVGIEGAPTPSLWSEGGDRAEGTLSAWCPLPNSKLLPRAPSRQSPESRADGTAPGRAQGPTQTGPVRDPWNRPGSQRTRGPVESAGEVCKMQQPCNKTQRAEAGPCSPDSPAGRVGGRDRAGSGPRTPGGPRASGGSGLLCLTQMIIPAGAAPAK